ncbi:Alpha/beta hydrolase [Saccharopolyspora kobensis]|uniref:Alpha/beta hydrolase n=1 Tax=Saccharopolyspora kobensis TaxID=146035 RepID=A0A1H6CYF1_9PSEU|nr:alpha/beta hydrolase [Saccharopolyspora kobensis]SEG78081.1 Alpha/beta hydrolase [Saccharopolyspora kobensis]SFD04461.1 Alpha/beta hydrolase [Saccharopolyspora kobensis]
MVSYADVRRWKPEELESAHSDLGNRRNDLVGLQDELDGAKKTDGWSGAAAEASAAEHAKLVDGMRSLIAEVATVRVAVASAADDVAKIKKRIEEADREAEANGFQITEEGGIRDVAPPQDVPEDQLEEVKQKRLQVRDKLMADIEKILDDAEQADAELAKALTSAQKDEIKPGEGGTLADAASTGDLQALAASAGKPAEDSPEANAEWWKSLSDEQRAALMEAPPAWLGNRDGIPAAARDMANRANIDNVRGDLVAERERLQAGGVTDDEQKKLDEINAKIASVDKVSETIGKEEPPRQLLVLDPSGERLKAAVAVGDVDKADHVSVFTPGFTTTVDGSLANYDDQMQELVAKSELQLAESGKKGDVAAVTWIGYEPPQWSETHDVLGDSVVSSSSAKEGGEKLNDFYQGINASRDNDPHLTAIGHSYGSTTTGYALQGGDHGVDDAILYGSPGVGTNDIKDLGVPEGHAYLLEAKNDPVADFARFGGDPSHMDGFTELSTAKSEHGGEVTGHSKYLNPDTTSQHNMAAVVAGVPERAVEGNTDGVGDVVSYVPHKTQEGISAAQEWGSETWSDVKDFGSDTWSGVKDFGSDTGSKIKDLFS